MADVNLRPRDVPRLGRVIDGKASGSDINALVDRGLIFPLTDGRYVPTPAARAAYFRLMAELKHSEKAA